METKIENVNLPAGTTEFVIRHDAAKVVYEPVKEQLVGNIFSVKEFVSKKLKMGLIDPKTAIFFLNKEKRTISFNTNPKDKLSSAISGQLEDNPDLEEYGINNSGKQYTTQQLITFLRMRSFHFEKKEVCLAVLDKLNTFKAKVEIDIQNEKEQLKGNAEASYKKKTNYEVISFILNLPLFKGTENKTFKVEIGADVTSGGVSMYLESLELKEIEDSTLKSIFDGELKEFKDEFIIIEE